MTTTDEAILVRDWLPLARSLARKAAYVFRLDPRECESRAQLELLLAIRSHDPARQPLGCYLKAKVWLALLDLKRSEWGERATTHASRAIRRPVSLAEVVHSADDSGREVTLGDCLPAPAEPPDTEDEARHARRLLVGLTTGERHAVWRHVVEGAILREVGDELGVTRGRVSSVLQGALAWLLYGLEARGGRP